MGTHSLLLQRAVAPLTVIVIWKGFCLLGPEVERYVKIQGLVPVREVQQEMQYYQHWSRVHLFWD